MGKTYLERVEDFVEAHYEEPCVYNDGNIEYIGNPRLAYVYDRLKNDPDSYSFLSAEKRQHIIDNCEKFLYDRSEISGVRKRFYESKYDNFRKLGLNPDEAVMQTNSFFNRPILSFGRDKSNNSNSNKNYKGGDSMAFFKTNRVEMRAHYNAVARGEKEVKADSKYTEAEQRAFARGAASILNADARMYAYSKATPEERIAYRRQRNEKKKAYEASKK